MTATEVAAVFLASHIVLDSIHTDQLLKNDVEDAGRDSTGSRDEFPVRDQYEQLNRL